MGGAMKWMARHLRALVVAVWLTRTGRCMNDAGYLFVSNRLDEVLAAAWQLNRVSARGANATLVADAVRLS